MSSEPEPMRQTLLSPLYLIQTNPLFHFLRLGPGRQFCSVNIPLFYGYTTIAASLSELRTSVILLSIFFFYCYEKCQCCSQNKSHDGLLTIKCLDLENPSTSSHLGKKIGASSFAKIYSYIDSSSFFVERRLPLLLRTQLNL